VVANLAVMLAGKIPVNSELHQLERSDPLRAIASRAAHHHLARPMAKKLENFPWTPEVLHLDEVLPAMKPAILAWWLVSLIDAGAVCCGLLHVPRVAIGAEGDPAFHERQLRGCQKACRSPPQHRRQRIAVLR
jgi:acyl-[acyl-carrier-protein]-phospholipid O-acyltransferase/long-chain-fatty-acid--[acyl-carrier-protein] ligase